MNLEDIQPWIVSLLKAEPGLAGVPVLAEDGTYPKTPERESALKTHGMALTVWEIESEGIVDSTNRGVAIEEVSIAVLIEESRAVTQGVGGIRLGAEKALRYVRSACLSKHPPSTRGVALLPNDPPFKQLGTQNGLKRIVGIFRLRLPMNPSD